MHELWRGKTYKVYLGKRLFWHFCLQLSFVYKIMSQISFNLFCSRNKKLLSEFLRKWCWFHEYNERFPKFQKTETRFYRWKSNITTTLISSCHRKILVLFYFRKKRPENALLTVTVNYRKIVQKNKLCHSKQH